LACPFLLPKERGCRYPLYVIRYYIYKKRQLLEELIMNDMRKLMEAVLQERPTQVGDTVMYKNKPYKVVGIDPNDFNKVLIKSQTSGNEGWVNQDKLSTSVSETEVETEIAQIEESPEIDIDTLLEDLEISIKNIISK
jgi:hypothetical protein